MTGLGVNLSRVFHYRVPLSTAPFSGRRKTALSTGVAGNAADLFYQVDHHIFIAVHADFMDFLGVPDSSPLFHSLLRDRDQ